MKTTYKKQKDLTSISWSWNTFFLLVLIVFAFITVAPVILLICISFSSVESLSTRGYVFIAAEWSLQGYEYLFKLGDQLWRSYFVSFAYAGFGTALSLVVMSLYAYVLYQRNFPLNKFLTWFLFITMIFNGGLIPSYMLITQYLHIGDTFFLLLISGMVAGYNIIIIRTFMRTAVPDTLLESARIDGAGHWRIYLTIVMPLMKAGLATVGLFGFVARWNDWFTGLLYIQKASLTPLQTLLWRLQQEIMLATNMMTNNAARMQGPDAAEILRRMPRTNLVMACTVAAIVPVIIVYPFFQRYFVRGMLVGSLKE